MAKLWYFTGLRVMCPGRLMQGEEKMKHGEQRDARLER